MTILDVSSSISKLSSYGINISLDQYNINQTKKVIVGLSGGVDSSVSALILKLMGFNVVGVHMKNWDTCNPDDFSDVVDVANILDIPYYAFNFTLDYKEKVFDSFIKDLNSGLTPNPDILCNKYIKFDVFFKNAIMLGADFIATGHYARIKNNNGKFTLCSPKDKSKDQTYFLYDVSSSVLDRVIFPLGDLLKSDVRKIARDFNLNVANKKDSTGICFIDNNNYRDFICDYINKTKGSFVDFDGNVIGSHDGLGFYTVGQSKGLKLSFKKGSLLAKRYSGVKLCVYKKDAKTNNIILLPSSDRRMQSRVVNGVKFNTEYQGFCLVRMSNLGNLYPAKVIGNMIILDEYNRRIAPGQSVVFYDLEGTVLGGCYAS